MLLFVVTGLTNLVPGTELQNLSFSIFSCVERSPRNILFIHSRRHLNVFEDKTDFEVIGCHIFSPAGACEYCEKRQELL